MGASFTSESFAPDNLLAGGHVLSRSITLALGQNLVRGAVLGKISVGAVTAAAKAGGNTGNGTISAVVALVGAKVGVYTVRFTAATVFTVEDADGNVIGTGSTGAQFADDLQFTITAGGTPFIAGDGFDLTVAAGSGKYVLSLASATDGSQVPDLILVEPTNASAADKVTVAYYSGDYLESGLTIGAGHTANSIREGLRVKGINLIPSVQA